MINPTNPRFTNIVNPNDSTTNNGVVCLPQKLSDDYSNHIVTQKISEGYVVTLIINIAISYTSINR